MVAVGALAPMRPDAGGNDDGWVSSGELGGERRQPIEMTLRPAIFKKDVSTFAIAEFGKALAEGDQKVLMSARRRADKNPITASPAAARSRRAARHRAA